jgi:phosphatidylserine decarboxylase
VKDRFFVWLQYLLPQHALSRLIHRLARVRQPWFKNAFIRAFVRLFRIDMSEASEPEPTAFESFNAFFTRSLRAEARPLPAAGEALVCPVDGTVSQAAAARDGRLLQAKDRDYALTDLLGDPDWARRLAGGPFATLYLAPYNYHRIHMPVSARLRRMIYLPGRLFSVNAATVRSVPRLFARNERVVCLFDTAAGPMAQVLVGALNVGSIETVWAGEVTPGRPRETACWDYDAAPVVLERGAEMGRFNMGSTVITVFASGRVSLATDLAPGQPVRVGQLLGTVLAPSSPPPSEPT